MTADSGALHGVRVLDLSCATGGAVAGMVLADLGADVLHAETVRRDPNAEPGYVCWDRNKTLTTIDLDRPSGLLEVRRLVAVADVVLVDWPRAELEKLRLDATTTLERNPTTVFVWMPAFGERGKWSGLDANPHLLAAVSGLADLYSATEDRPVLPVVPLLAYEQGAMAAAMAVAGLLQRHRTNRGQSIAVSGLHSVAAMLAAVLLDAPNMVRPPKSARPALPHYRHYECSDEQWLFLAALAQPFFLQALEVMDLLEIMVLPGIDGEWLHLQNASLNQEAIARLEARFAERPRDEWLKILADADVPCAPVQDRETWFDSETVATNELRVRAAHRELGEVELPAVPISLSAAPTAVRHLPDSDHRVPTGVHWSDVTSGVQHESVLEAVDGPPLAGLRVLDLSSFVAGTLGPSILAMLGAEVIKVETADGDPYRDFSVSFAAYNQAKLGLGLDLKDPQGHAAFCDLAAQADVVVDGVRPSVRKRLGTDFASLHALNPRLVRCSVTGWGERGELAETPAFDPLLQARSGLMVAQGGTDDPVFASMLVHDVGTGTLAALGILAALYQREATGEGQEVRVSLASSSVFLQSGELVRFDGRPPTLVGGRDWSGPGAFERLYRCADGWVVVAATSVTEQRALLDAMEAAPLAREGVGEQELERVFEAAFGALRTEEVVDRLVLAGVPVASVLPRTQAYSDQWLAENGFFHRFDQPGIGQCTVIAGYASWQGVRLGYGTPAPRIGEHTRLVLQRWGIDPTRIVALIECGAAHEMPSD